MNREELIIACQNYDTEVWHPTFTTIMYNFSLLYPEDMRLLAEYLECGLTSVKRWASGHPTPRAPIRALKKVAVRKILNIISKPSIDALVIRYE